MAAAVAPAIGNYPAGIAVGHRADDEDADKYEAETSQDPPFDRECKEPSDRSTPEGSDSGMWDGGDVGLRVLSC
jgi:hypothetical protein